MNNKVRFRRKRLLDKIQFHVKELNVAMKLAHENGLKADAILETKLLPYPLLDVRVLKYL